MVSLHLPSARIVIQTVAIATAIFGIATLFTSNESRSTSNNLRTIEVDKVTAGVGRRLSILDPKTVSLRKDVPLTSDAASVIAPAGTLSLASPGVSFSQTPTSGQQQPREAVLTSWYTYTIDPQRKYVVQKDDITYMINLYTTSVHFGIPLVVFHDSLAEEFTQRYTAESNGLVTFQRVIPEKMPNGKIWTTNDFRFFPYLEYIQQHQLENVWMVDASDCFFQSNPFDYIRQYEGPNSQLFMSEGTGKLTYYSWRVAPCYKDEAKHWPDNSNTKYYGAGVWGGKGPAVQCILQCISEQLHGVLMERGNCNQPAVNYCVNHYEGCKAVAPVHTTPNNFVNNPPTNDCRGPFPIIHDKCPETEFHTVVNVDPGNGQLVIGRREGMSTAEKQEKKLFCRRAKRRGDNPTWRGQPC